MSRSAALACEGCGKTIEIVPEEVPQYKKAIDAGWRLEYHPPEMDGEPPWISAKCDLCRTRSIRRTRFARGEDELRERTG